MYWAKHARPSDTFSVYAHEPIEARDLHLTSAFAVETLRPALKGFLWESLVLSRQKNLDVLFCPSYTRPLWYRGPTVVATHSVNEVFEASHPWWYDFTYTPYYRRSARLADRVVVPCESTRRDVHSYYGVPLERVDVVPEGADEGFRPLHDEALLQETRKRYFGTDRPYVLFVGKFSQRRNIPTLMAAYACSEIGRT